MTTVEKRHSSRKGRGHRKHSSGGLSDTSSGGSFLDDTDREVSSLTDRAFRSLCIGEEAVYNDSDLGSSPSALKERHQAFSQEITVAPDSQVREKRDRDPVKGAAQRSFSLQRCGLGGGEAGWEREQEGRLWAGQYGVGTRGYSVWEGQGEGRTEGRVSVTFQRSFTDVSQQEKTLREERLSFLSNGGSDPSWQQRRSRSRVSSLIKAFSSEGYSGGDGGMEGKLKEWNNECSWDKSALMSIQRELSEFSTAYNHNFPTGPFPTAGSFPQQTGPFPGSGNSLYPSEVPSTATASFLRSSHGKISSKHSMFTQLDSTSNLFLHSEFSPFQPLWRDNNRFPFHQGYVAGFMSSADFPKWYDSPMYKEMTLEQQFHGFRGFKETGSRPQHKPLEAVAPPPPLRSTSTMLQKASAVEKHSDYEMAGHYPPWKRAQSVGSNRYPSLRPSTISPTNERSRRGQDAVSSLNEFQRTEQVATLTAEQSVTMLVNSSAQRDAVDGIDNRATSFSNKVSTVAVQQAVVTSNTNNTPFNITQLLTPVIHNQQDTESTPEGVQMAHNQPAIMGERERRGPTPEVRMASYKSRASGLLFNLKDNRKRVKSTYSPTKFTGMEVTRRSKSNLGGYGHRDTVVDIPDALPDAVPQVAGEREPSAVCQPQTNPQCDPTIQPTTAHHLQHLNYTDTNEAEAYRAIRSSQTREEMVHHQEYRGNYRNSNLPTTRQNDPCELPIPSPAVIDSIQTSDVNRTVERYSKGSGYEQGRGKQYGSIDASSQESWKQHVSNTTYHGREAFGVNDRVTDMRPWKGEIAALIEKDKQSLLSRTAATMKKEPKQNYDWNVVNGQGEKREPGKQYVPEGRVHPAEEVLISRNSLPHKEVLPISDYTKNQNDLCRSAGQDNIKPNVNLESDRTYAVRNTLTERGQPVHAKPHGLWVEQNKRHQVYFNKEQYDQDVQWNSSYKNDNRQYSANASTSARWGKDHSENTDNTITMLQQTVGKYPRNEAFTTNDLDGMHSTKVLAKAEKANGKAEQMKAELPKAEHSKAEKAKADLENADKAKAELAKAEDKVTLAKTENTKAELSKADIAKAQAVVAQTELAKAELAIAQAELAKAELAKAQAELAKAELVKAQADLAKAELAKAQAEQVKAEHTKTEQAEAELAKCKRDKEEKLKAELTTVHLSKAELVQEDLAISKAELANAEKAKNVDQTQAQSAKAKQAIIKPEKAKNDDPAKCTSWSTSEDRYGINNILTTRDYEQVKKERLGEKRYSVNEAVPTTVEKVSNEIIYAQAEIKKPLQKDVAPISSYEQEDRGQDEYTGFREKYGFSHEVSVKENKHRSIEVAATDESKKIDSPATINHETAITTTGYTKDESISNQRLDTKVEEQVLGNKENNERWSEGQWVYSESSKQFKLASQIESRMKPSDQSLSLSKEVHLSSFRPMSLKEKGQTKQQLLTSKLKAQAEKEISAIKEKGFGKQDGILLRNPTKHLEKRERGQSGQESKIIKNDVSKGQTNNDLCINKATAQSQHKGKAKIEESTVSDDQQSITSLKGARNKSQVSDGTEKDMLQSTEDKSQNECNSDENSCKLFSGKSEAVSEDDSLQIMGIMVTITEPSLEKEDGFIAQQEEKGNGKREDEAIKNKLPYNNSGQLNEESDPTITPKADQAALSKSGVSSKREDSTFADHVIPEKTRQQTQLSDGKAETQTEHAARESKQVTLAPETTNSYPENPEKPPSNGSDRSQKEILVHDTSAVKDGLFAEVKQAKNKQLAETQPLFFKQGITESNTPTTTETTGKGDSSFQDGQVENLHIDSIAVCVVAGTHQTDNQQDTESHSVAKHVSSGAENPTGDNNVHIDSIAIRVVSGVTENETGKTTANDKANNSADPTGETSSFKPEVNSRQKQLPTVPTAIADYARLKVISTEEHSPSKTDSKSRTDGYFPMIQTRRSRPPVFSSEQREQPVAGVMLGREGAAVKEPEVPYKLNTGAKIGGVLSSMEQQQRKTGMFSLREKAKEAISLNKEGLTGTTDTHIFKHNNVPQPEHATGLENHPEYQPTQTAHEPGKPRFSPKVDATQYMEAMQVSLGNEYITEKREEQSKVEERTKRQKEVIKEVERRALKRNEERVAREDEEYRKEKERREQQKQKEEKRREAERKEKERREEEKKEMEKRELQKQREEEKKEEELREVERKEKERREEECRKLQKRREEEKKEAERKEAERKEMERREKERREEERKEKERREIERIQKETREEERREAERIEKERKEKERREKERIENERRVEEMREEERREKERIEERKEKERREAERIEMKRREEERREKEKIEAERKENERREAKKKEEERRKLQKLIEEKKEAERKEAERKEMERREKEKIEWHRREVERREKERQDKERREAERIEEEKREKARKEEERREKERIEKEKKEKERREAERIKKEREEERRKEERRENERIEKERREKERIEKERKEKERREAERIKKEREEERRNEERRENERIEKERREERIEKERKEKERKDAERIEKERREEERREKERIEAERKENERREAKKKEEERRKLQKLIEEKKEAERKEAERKEMERREKERQEKERREAERIEEERREERRQEERREKERSEKERQEKERIEAERIEEERREDERREKERIKKERREAERREHERIEAERKENERREEERRKKERIEKERKEEERREKERIEAERKENERREAKKNEEEQRKLQKLIEEKKEADQKEAERKETEREERERREAERIEKEKKEEERREKERIEEKREEECRKLQKRREEEKKEAERKEAEKKEMEQREKERREEERREEERKEKERREVERIQKEMKAKERSEAERIEQERKEKERREKERRKIQKLKEEKEAEMERKEKEKKEAERIEKEKKEEETIEKERMEKERRDEEKKEEERRKLQKCKEDDKKEMEQKVAERKENERREEERRARQREEEIIARQIEERKEKKKKEEERRKRQREEEQKEKELREQHKWREERKEERREEERREDVRREQQQQQDVKKREAEMKEENRIARQREEERKEKDRRERLREEEKNEEERKELQLQREEKQKEKRRARQREEEKMDALQYYSISSPENQARPRDRPLFSPQPSPHRGNPEDWESHVRPHLHTSPAPPSTRSNTSSPALGGKPTMFRVKDNTFRSSSLTKSVKPRFHKSFGEEFRVGSPLWSGSERGDEVHERTRERGHEAHRECTGTPEYHESDISSHRQTRVRDTQHANDHTALSEPTTTQPYSRPYSRRSVVLDDDDSRSMISNMSGDAESYATSVADMSERSSGLYDSEFTSRGCYNRPDSACSFASDVGRPMGKPPAVPPKSDKALRRAKRLTTRRIKKESKPETEVEADPVENPVHDIASVPSSPSELGSSKRPARASAHFSAPVSLPLAPTSISSVPFAPTDLRSSHRPSFYASSNAKAPTSLPHVSPHPRVPGQVGSVSSTPTYHHIAHPRHLVSPLASPLTSPLNVPQYHVDPNYTSPSGLSLPQPFTQSLTQKKVLQDPGSGQYFVVDMPVQVETKTFFDLETGKYVQLNVRQPGQGGSLSQAQPQSYPQSLPSYIQPPTYPPYTQSPASPAGRPYVLYQGYPQNYQSLPVSSLSTHRSHSGMSVLETPTQDCQNPDPKEESQGWAGDGEGQGEAWSNQGYGGQEVGMARETYGQSYNQEQTPYMDTAHDTHGCLDEGTVYVRDANSVPHRDIITMSELEDFAMDSGDWL